MSNAKPTALVTGKVRISYEHLVKEYANQQGAEPKFSATLLIPKSDTATRQRIDAAIQAAIQEGTAGKWGGSRPQQPPVPIYDGDGLRPSGEAFGAECAGCWVMTASSKLRPNVVDINIQPILDATQIYSGMYARVSINFFAYNSAGKKGIGCGLGNVQKLEDGEPLGGRTTAEEDFGGAPAYQQTPPPAQYPQYAQQPQQFPPQYGTPAQGYLQMPQGYPAIDPITGQPVAG
ncbi:MAG: DUF2815 family protein [Acetanaerobacterium sp.]